MNVKALNITFFLTFFLGLLFVNPVIGRDADAKAERTARLAADYNDQVMHHISNANEFHVVGDIHIPLPCILYAPSKGFDVFMSSEFEHGSKAVEGYVLIMVWLCASLVVKH